MRLSINTQQRCSLYTSRHRQTPLRTRPHSINQYKYQPEPPKASHLSCSWYNNDQCACRQTVINRQFRSSVCSIYHISIIIEINYSTYISVYVYLFSNKLFLAEYKNILYSLYLVHVHTLLFGDFTNTYEMCTHKGMYRQRERERQGERVF